MRDKYAPSILSAKGKTIVLLSAAGLLAAGIYGATKVGRVIVVTFPFIIPAFKRSSRKR